MYQGTTPTIPLTFKSIDLTEAKIYLTFFDEKQKRNITFESGVDFTVEYVEDDTVGELTLTQEQTLAMSEGIHQAQARWIFPDGATGATNKAKVKVNDVLLKDVIKYE